MEADYVGGTVTYVRRVQIRPSRVHKTAFATIDGMFLSLVPQQGDANGPSTCQRLMTSIFREYIGRFVYVILYLDDIFMYSRTVRDYDKDLRLVFDALRRSNLFLSATKVDIFLPSMECLGYVINGAGLHADVDKLETTSSNSWD